MVFSFPNGPGLYQMCAVRRRRVYFRHLHTPTNTLLRERGCVRELKRLAWEKREKEANFFVFNGKELKFGLIIQREKGKHEDVLTNHKFLSRCYIVHKNCRFLVSEESVGILVLHCWILWTVKYGARDGIPKYSSRQVSLPI